MKRGQVTVFSMALPHILEAKIAICSRYLHTYFSPEKSIEKPK